MRLLQLVLVCSILLSAHPLHAKDDKKKEKTHGFFFYIPVEYTFINSTGIDNALATAKLPETKYPFMNYGGGIQYYTYRAIFSLSYSGLSRNTELDTASMSVEMAVLSLNVGYDLFKRTDRSLFPYVGYKNYRTDYVFNEKVTTTPSVAGYLTTPLDHKELRNTLGHIDLGMGFSYQKNFQIGLRAGYLLPIENVKWRTNNGKVQLSGSPDLSYSAYIMLSLGIGTIISEDRELIK